jgi:hypothetical protein
MRMPPLVAIKGVRPGKSAIALVGNRNYAPKHGRLPLPCAGSTLEEHHLHSAWRGWSEMGNATSIRVIPGLRLLQSLVSTVSSGEVILCGLC